MKDIKCPCGLRNHMDEEDCNKTNCDDCCPLAKGEQMTMNEDRCVCCGAVIPEGRMVCPNCLVTVKEVKQESKDNK